MESLGGIDPGAITGLGVIGVLLGLIFRTLWRQNEGWTALLDSQRETTTDHQADAEQARLDAAEARESAKKAHEQAQAAFIEAGRARRETVQCQLEHELTNKKLQFLINTLRDMGITIPPMIDHGEPDIEPPNGDE